MRFSPDQHRRKPPIDCFFPVYEICVANSRFFSVLLRLQILLVCWLVECATGDASRDLVPFLVCRYWKAPADIDLARGTIENIRSRTLRLYVSVREGGTLVVAGTPKISDLPGFGSKMREV